MDRDPIAMLRAANPVSNDALIDFDALIARTMARATAPRSHFRVMRTLKARIITGFSLVTAVAVGAVIALTSLGVSTLAPLDLAASGPSRVGGQSVAPTMMICQWCLVAPYTFVGSGLSSATSSATASVLSSPDPSSAASALVGYLGLAHVTTTTPDAGVVEVTSTTTTLDVASTDLGSIYLSDPSGLALPGNASMSAPALESSVAKLLASVAPGYQLVDPQVTFTQPDPTNSVAGDEYVSYSVSVEGHLITNLSVAADFNTQGQLLTLTAPLFSVASTGSYPLISPAGGVATLNAEAAFYRNERAGTPTPLGGVSPAVPLQPSKPQSTTSSTNGVGATNATGSSPGATVGSTPPVTPSTSSNVPTSGTTNPIPSVVTLTSASLEWYLSALSNGKIAAIPVYVYSGTYSDGTSATLAWKTPALDPSVASVPEGWVPFQFWPWGRVIPMMLSGTGGVTSSTPSVAIRP